MSLRGAVGSVPQFAWAADFFEHRRLPDHVGLVALAALGPDIVWIDVAAAVGAEIDLGLDERARIGDHVDDALMLIKAFCRDRLGEEFGDAGIARVGHALFLGMAGEHDDPGIRIGVGAGLADHLSEFKPVEDGHRPVSDVMREGFRAGRAGFGFINVARPEAVPQRAQNPAHMGVVAEDEET